MDVVGCEGVVVVVVVVLLLNVLVFTIELTAHSFSCHVTVLFSTCTCSRRLRINGSCSSRPSAKTHSAALDCAWRPRCAGAPRALRIPARLQDVPGKLVWHFGCPARLAGSGPGLRTLSRGQVDVHSRSANAEPSCELVRLSVLVANGRERCRPRAGNVLRNVARACQERVPHEFSIPCRRHGGRQ